MPLWKLSDPRAVVPPPSMDASRDVVCPTIKHCHASPSPLGLGLYCTRTRQSIPLFYVSPRAAADRSPARNINNAAGVRHGWYAIATPGRPFEVRITRVNKPIPGSPDEDQITAKLLVDGLDSNNPEAFHVDGDLYDERVAMGFVERYETSADGTLERKVRRFAFRKATATEGGEGSAQRSATIGIEARVGVAIPREGVRLLGNYCYDSAARINEKEVAKEGKSIGVRRDGARALQSRRIARFRTIRERPVPESTVTVYLREQNWMRSRRLVDDYGEPCTYEMYKALLLKDSGQVSAVEEIAGCSRKRTRRTPAGIDHDKKRARNTPTVIDVDKEEDEEVVIDVDAAVVDLT